jgi:hypothetical protein
MAGVADAERLLLHLEGLLGPLQLEGGASEQALRASGAPFAVLAFESPTGASWATFGLSRHLLALSTETARQEFVLSVGDGAFAVDAFRTLGSYVLQKSARCRPESDMSFRGGGTIRQFKGSWPFGT